jgi:hypothetical protein
LLEEIVLRDGEAEVIAFPKEQGSRFGPREPARRVEDSLEERIQITLGGEGEPNLEKLLDELAPIDHGLRAH